VNAELSYLLAELKALRIKIDLEGDADGRWLRIGSQTKKRPKRRVKTRCIQVDELTVGELTKALSDILAAAERMEAS
jgi:hypothetical protein